MTRWAMEGQVSKELISYQGAVLYHDNPRELEWLFQKSYQLGTLRTVELPRNGLGRPLMRLKDHPDLASVTWPLNPADFLLMEGR